MRRTRTTAWMVAAALLAGTLAAAQAGAEQKIKGEIARVMGESLKSLPHYSYQQRTDVRMNGEDTGATLVQVAFGPDGKPMVTPLSAPEPSGRPKRGIRGAVQENMQAEVKQQVEALVKLAGSYTLLDQARLQDLMKRSVLEIVPSASADKLVVSSFLQPGDQAIYKFDAGTYRQTHLNVTTSAGGNPVTIHVLFQTLPTGLTYPAQTDISVPAKGLAVTVNTLNYVGQ